MTFHGMETIVVELLRTVELQRLRRVRQLGLAHLVFPGAEHSRLVHSLGASHLALRFGRQLREAARGFLVGGLRPGEQEIRDLAVAALCHDTGHGPLSHAWEREVIRQGFDVKKWAESLGLDPGQQNLVGLTWHELVTQGLLAWREGHLHQLLENHEQGFSGRLRSMLLGEYYIPYLPRLLKGDIDLDRADYLRRDTHQCGVAYGRYDLEWLISTCTIGKTKDGRLVVGFDRRKALRVVEQFLVARRALYETVYCHKTVRAVEGMVALFLRRLREVLEQGSDVPVPRIVAPFLKAIAGVPIGPEDLLALDDYSLWVLIDHVSRTDDVDSTAQDLALRIVSRDLFKLIPCPSDQLDAFLTMADGYDRIYNAIRPVCPGLPEYYLAVDIAAISTFSDDANEMGYFIDGNRVALPMHDDSEMRHNYVKPQKLVRAYTLSEGVELALGAIRAVSSL